MTKKLNETLSESLGIEFEKETVSKIVSSNVSISTSSNISSNTSLTTYQDITYSEVLSQDIEESEEDFIKVRDNFNNLLEKGETAIESMLEIASNEESARGFEVVATLIKTMSDVSKDFYNIHDIRQKLKNPSGKSTPPLSGINVEKAVFVGSPQQLLKEMKQRELEESNGDRIGYHGNPNLITPNMEIFLTAQEQLEYLKCMRDPIYFIRNYVNIISLDAGLIKFNMRQYQEEMVQTFSDNRFSICKIPRQYGKSTIMCAYILHQTMFNEQFVTAIICDKKDLAKELLSRIKLSYEYLPTFLKQAIVSWNKGDIEFANGSKVKTFAAGGRGVAGNSINLLYLDEFAHVAHKQAEAFWQGAYPVITAGTQSKVIITSTPAGAGSNLFYQFWDKSIHNQNDFKPIEVHWSAIPGRDQKWKEQQLRQMSPEKFAAEFDCEFVGSTNTLISSSKLALIKNHTKNPILIENSFKVFEIPQKDHVYAITVDTAEGQDKDYSAFSVIDVTSIPYIQVARYRDKKIQPLLYPSIVYNVAKTFNDAYVLVEVNSIGVQVASILYYDLSYENILKVDTKSPLGTGQHIAQGGKSGLNLGLKTSSATKRIGCTLLKSLIENDKLLINDIDTIHELETFSEHKDSYAAEEGSNDDLAMTLVLFSWLSNQRYFKETLDNDVRAVLQGEKIHLKNKPFLGFIDNGIPEYTDHYQLNWKSDFNKMLSQQQIQVDDSGDIWIPVENSDNWMNNL